MSEVSGIWRRAPDSRLASLVRLALPISLALMGQNAFSLATVAMIGRLDIQALAGVGVANAMISMLAALLYGLDAAVQAIAARYAGANEEQGLAVAALRDGLWLSVALAVAVTTLAYLFGPSVIASVVRDPVAARYGRQFLLAVAPSLLILGPSFAFNAYWNGCGRPRFALIALLVQVPCGVILTYGLVFGALALPRLEALGAGLAGTLAALIAFVVQLVLAGRQQILERVFGSMPDLNRMRLMLSIGLPISLQQMLVMLASMVLLAISARVGVHEVAVTNVLFSIILVPILASTGLGIATGILVGQLLGADDVAAARRLGWEAATTAAVVTFAGAALVQISPTAILGLFIHSPSTIALGILPFRIVVFAMGFDGFARTLSFSARGAGATGNVALVSFLTLWIVQLPLAWWLAVEFRGGLVAICAAMLVSFTLEAAAMAMIWRAGSWSKSLN